MAYPQSQLLLATTLDFCSQARCKKGAEAPFFFLPAMRSPAYLAAAAPLPAPRMALKNSVDDGSSTSTSLFLLKLAL